MASSHRTTVGILDMSRHLCRWEKKCHDLICFIAIDRGQFLTPFDTFGNRYVPYRITFQPVHPKSHVVAKYSHGCSVLLAITYRTSDLVTLPQHESSSRHSLKIIETHTPHHHTTRYHNKMPTTGEHHKIKLEGFCEHLNSICCIDKIAK